MAGKGLLEKLANGENVIVAEGYLFEFERRGYLKAGAFVPEIILQRPDLVKSLHEEFVHAGSDVVLAFTYYAHREKMQAIGRENDVKTINQTALRLAREVADETGTLMAGNICNSTVYDPADPKTFEIVKHMFKEQVEWAVDGKADFIVAETFGKFGEAKLALQAIKDYGHGLPSVVTMAARAGDVTEDGENIVESLRRLEEAGANVVGLNCCRGPETMLQLLPKIRQACQGPIAALPVVYRTRPDCPTFQSLRDPDTGKLVFPVDLPSQACSRREIAEFAQKAKEIGVQYVGLCCGNASHYTRVMAEAYGRCPPSSRFSPDMSQHYAFGSDVKFFKPNIADDIKRLYFPNS